MRSIKVIDQACSCSCFIFAIYKLIYNISIHKEKKLRDANKAYVMDYPKVTKDLTKQ